jgi:hypothetical protein
MRLRSVVSCVVAILLVVPLLSIDGFAQSATTTWSGVTSLQPGQKVSIELKNGKKVKGKFGSASETSITISRGKNTEDVTRADIRKVFRENGGSVGKSTLVGAGIGGGAGAILGVSTGGCDNSGWFCITRGQAAAVVGIMGATVGALTGLVVGLLRKNRTLIYEGA